MPVCRRERKANRARRDCHRPAAEAGADDGDRRKVTWLGFDPAAAPSRLT
jgi:hypothetical protein